MENKYKVNYTQNVDSVNTTFQLNTSGTVGEVCEPNTEWTGIPYAGTSITNLNECAYLSWGNDYQDTSISGNNLGRSNLRFAILWYSSGTTRDVSRFAYRWTGLPESIVNYYKTNDRNNVQLFNPLSNEVVNVGTLGSRSPWFISFLNELKINNLIFNVVISVSDLKFSGYRSGEAEGNTSGRYYSTITESNKQYYNWKDIRAEDNLPEGLAYDDDLWNNGYKVLAQDSDSITYRIVKGATLIPYYGNSSNTYNSQNDSYINSVVSPVYGDRQNFGIIASSSADSPTFNSNTRSNPRLIIIADGTGIGSTIYHSVNGIKFNNSSAVQIEYGLNQSGIQQWTRGTDYLGSNDFNVANQLYDSGTNNGGIIEEFLSATPTGHVLVPGIKGGGGTLSTDNDTWGDSASSVFRYIPVLESTGATIALCYRKSYAQCATLGCVYPIKELWQTIATFGCYVGDDEVACQKAQLGVNVGDNDHIYLGEMLADGTTTGNMLQGGEISNSIQASIDDIIQDTPYVPPTPGGGGDDPDDPSVPKNDQGSIPYNSTLPVVGAATSFLTSYILNTAQVNAVGYNLWSKVNSNTETDARAMLSNFYRLNNSGDVNVDYGLTLAEIPDYFISLRWFPFSLGNNVDKVSTGESAIRVGTGLTPIGAGNSTTYTIQNAMCYLDGGSLSVPWTYESYLDYEPYTSASIYVPYCGTTEVQPSLIMGRTLSLHYSVSLLTGAICSIIMVQSSNGVSYPLCVMNGMVGFDIAITGNTQNAQIRNALTARDNYYLGQWQTISGGLNSIGKTSAIAGLGAGLLNGGNPVSAQNIIDFKDQIGLGGLSSSLRGAREYTPGLYGNIVGGLSAAGAGLSLGTSFATGLGNLALDKASFENQLPYVVGTQPLVVGSSSSMANLILPQTAFVQIRRKNRHDLDSETYGNAFGYESKNSKRLGDLNGFTKCVNPKLSIAGATESELNLIYGYLQTGVYL